LVGPSTAVTPAPRARALRSVAGEKEIGIEGPDWPLTRLPRIGGGQKLGQHLYHNNTPQRPVLNVWNESGTNHVRIGDSRRVRLRSLRHMAQPDFHYTRSGVRRLAACEFSAPKS
jgi:hypothetical protein